MLCEFCKNASKIDKAVAQNNVFVEANLKQGAHMFFEGCITFIILHFCVDKPNCNRASMPSGLLARLTTLIKNEYESLFHDDMRQFAP